MDTAPPGSDMGPVLGYVHLEVTDLDRAVRFYCDVLGFDVRGRVVDQVFLATGDYHHQMALATSTARPPHPGSGHIGIRYPTRLALADALRRASVSGARIARVVDHGAFEAAYLGDPDGNEIALYWDRPCDEWPRTAAGAHALVAVPFDAVDLLGTAADPVP